MPLLSIKGLLLMLFALISVFCIFFIVQCQSSFLKIYNSSISHSIGFFLNWLML